MHPLAGTGTLVRAGLRRDRVILPLWISVFVMMAYSSAAATTELYSSVAARSMAMDSINRAPVMVALYGRIYSDSLGAVSLIKMSGMGAAMLAILGFMVVIRHTRAEEEAGRFELLGSTAIGRSAILASSLIIGFGACVTIGVLSGASLVAAGLPAEGSFAFGLAWAATGCAFCAVGALAAQLTTGGRAAAGISAGFLGLAYMVRAVGDATGDGAASWFSWLSPIAWGQQVRPFAQERWPVLFLLVAFTLVVSVAAARLASRRDLGAGLLADRPGPAHAGRLLGSPLGLVTRLERGTLIGWAVAVTLGGAIIGSIATQLGGLLDTPEAREFFAALGGTEMVTDAYIAMELSILGVIIAIFGMETIIRARNDEADGRADAPLAAPVGRGHLLGGFVTVSIVGTAGLILLAGFATAVGDALQTGSTARMDTIMLGSAIQIPAAWVMVGIVVVLFGVLPRYTKAVWGVFAVFLLIGEFGPVFKLPGWVMDVSPFAHTPRYPGGDIDAGPLIGLVVAAVALLAVGFAAYQRRDA